ncbi:MAG: UDP-N-acetylmuramate--L-alanine ligase, partial [Clostridia bacterium]|nr:UDP-N-acetylmuramate--L-alanine ligase [Clostridia bacterium]
ADVVVMADVYAAREKNVNGISSKDIRKYLPSAEYFGSFEEIAEFIKENAKEGDMAITMCAGDVYKVSDFLF